MTIDTSTYYTSIDEMPIWNWEQISKTGKLKFVFISCEGDVNDNIVEAWDNLQDQYIKKIGLDPDFEDILRIKNNISNLRYDLILTGNRFNNTLIAIEMAELTALQSMKGMAFEDLLIHVSKHMGFRPDLKSTSVSEWNFIIKNMKDGQAN